jgi:hypothetical protein
VRAIVKDSAVLSAILLDDVIAYLRSTGWRKSEDDSVGLSQLWLLEQAGAEEEVVLPQQQAAGDYTTRLAQCLGVLELVENRSQLDILREMNLAGYDVFRVRAIENDSRVGAIDVLAGKELIDGAISLMESASATVDTPRRAVTGRRSGQVDSFMRGLELGQSERGSYVVTVLTRVGRPSSVEELFPDFIELFPRRVTMNLASALGAARRSVSEVAGGGNVASFDDAVGSGVTADLCEAIAAMLGSEEHRGGALDLSIAWSRAVPSQLAEPRVSFNQHESTILMEAAEYLRAQEPETGIFITGVVTRLRREDGASAGVVTVSCAIGGIMRKLLVPLAGVEYELAINCHLRRRGISFTADVRLEGRSYTATEVRDLRIVE